MTVSSIKVKVQRKAIVKLKVIPKFPANIEAGEFLTITRAGNSYTFNVDYSVLTPGPIRDPTTAYVAISDTTAGIYRTVTLASLLTSGLDADLQAIAALTGTGILARTADGAWALRTITAGTGLGVTNGGGVAGNPTISITDAELLAIAGLVSAADQLPYFTGSGTAALASFPTFGRSIAASASQSAARTVLALTPGTDVQAFDTDLAALAANSGTGLWSVTGSGTGSVRTLTAPAAGITVSNGGGVAGNPTLALANDLAALEGLSSTGIARRTATDTWSVGTAVSNAELATMAAYTFKGNATGSTAAVTDVDIGALTQKASPVGTDEVMIRDNAASGAWRRALISAIGSAGSVGSFNTRTGAVVPQADDYGNLDGLTLHNVSLSASASAGALTITLNDASGSTPSSTSPAVINFRSATGATGSTSVLAATGSTTLVIPSGQNVGVTSSTAFRLWVVIFNDAGTLRIGVINCSTASSTSTQIFPLNEGVPASSTAIAAAPSAGIFYTGTAVSAKAFRIVGYLEWNSSGMTAGTWTITNLSFVQIFGFGIKRPGEALRISQVTTTTGGTTTANSYSSILSTSIALTSAANLVRLRSTGYAAPAPSLNSGYVTAFRGPTQLQSLRQLNLSSGFVSNMAGHDVFDFPNTTSSTTYSVQIKSDGTNSTGWANAGDAGAFGTMTVEEIMG